MTIEKQLLKATGLTAKKGESRQDFLTRLNMAATDLSDDAWAKLDAETQEWLNSCADIMNDKANKKKELPDFPDAEQEEEEEEEQPRRRRSAAKEEPADEEVPKVGSQVKLVTKRGKEYTGKIIEMDDEVVVIETGDDEHEFNRDKIGVLQVVGSKSRKVEADDEPETYEPKVGDKVTAENTRGKVVTGKIIEIDDEAVVIDDGENEHEFQRARLKSLTPAGGKAKPAAKEEPTDEEDEAEEKPAGRRKASAKEEEPAKRTRASNGTVSVGTAIRALILDNLEASEEEIAKLLKKQGVDCKENTLGLNFNEAHKFLKQIKEKGMLKTPK